MKLRTPRKIVAGLVLSGALVATLLAGCSNAANAVAGPALTVTVTAGGAGNAAPVTVTATKTVASAAGAGNNAGGAVMDGLVVYGDIVSSTVGCIEISNGHRGEVIVPRATVIDPKTGAFMDDKSLATVAFKLADTSVAPIALKYGAHGKAPYTDNFWAGSWEVPLDEPMGVMPYTIVATAVDGRTGTFSAFNVATSMLNIAQYDPNVVAGKSAKITATGFSVATLTASQNAKVTFTNSDIIPHTLYFPDKNSGPIGTTAPNNTYVYQFTTAGSVTVYLDSANSANKITVTVNPAPAQ